MAARVDKLLPGNQQVAMGQLATPMKSLKISDDDVAVMATWDASQTAGWLEQIGLGIFAQQFTEHQITGDLLPLLSKEELKDMGIGLVGPRTQLLKHIFKLKLRYQNVQRNRVVWEALEKQHCLEGCFEPPDKYTLTNSSLKMTEKVYPFGKLCGICCGCKGTKINTIDIGGVKDVDAASAQACGCCGHDEVYIDAEGLEKGRQVMRLQLGMAPTTVKMIRDTIEETQQNVGNTAVV